MKPTLLVLAAGMGSRYGGLKQIDQVGPSGETIIDYSVYDAIRAGFGKVVFVIRRDIEEAFKNAFGNKFSSQIQVEYVFQELDMLPEGFNNPEGRVKPWGTGHAVLVAKDHIREPFAMINADDFYGKEGFEVLAEFLRNTDPAGNTFSIVGYKLNNTLSDHGSVNRGEIHTNEEGYLTFISERIKIRREGEKVVYEENEELFNIEEDALVSMNMMGFTPKAFEYFEEFFISFLKERGTEMKSEFYVPTMLDKAIKEKGSNVEILTSDASWFGVTYKEDKQMVVDKLAELTKQGVYPSNLWS
ncbi:MAG: nucleotidyltransferase [Bacteroidia bacterium]|nr:nucleotidyltransferase [Bacteroidia bacterium]